MHQVLEMDKNSPIEVTCMHKYVQLSMYEDNINVLHHRSSKIQQFRACYNNWVNASAYAKLVQGMSKYGFCSRDYGQKNDEEPLITCQL